MQYTRLMKKAMQDLINGRGDAKTHISKIIYYGAVQNFIFSAMQSALFAMIPGFDDEEDESGLTEKQLEKKREKEQRKEDTRYLRIINSMTDSVLKGSGVKGAVLATIKNTITEYFKQKEKGWTADHAYTLLAALSLSPPIGSKVRKIYSAIQGEKFDKDVLEARGFSVMADGRVNLSPAYSIIGSLVSGTANVPMDRMVDIINSMVEATDNRNTVWQRIALAMGWKTWDVGAKNEEHDLIIQQAKEKRKEEGKVKAKETREQKKIKEKEYIEKMTKGMSIREKAFWLKNYKESKKKKK
jgi:CRISPR/Cas system CMR subunit Cmr4 (Cas7 group RAMP superfamily)